MKRPHVEHFLRRLGLQYPIIQAPMAGASSVDLAATVSHMGGLGSLPLGGFSDSPDKIEQQMMSFEDIVGLSHSVNLNFFCHEQTKRDELKDKKWLDKYKGYYEKGGIEWDEKITQMKIAYPSFSTITDASDKTVQKLIQLSPKVVSFHFGIPSLKVIGALQHAQIAVFVSATNLEEFKLCHEAAVDGVVLQGWEAGGHRGNFTANDPNDSKLSTQELLQAVVSYIKSASIASPPFLIASGGIHSSSQITSLLDQGASAVQLGTIWLATEQCTISTQHLHHIQHPEGLKTFMSPAISGRTLRTIETPFLKELTESSPVEEIPSYPLPYDAFKNLVKDAKATADGANYLAFLSGSAFDKSWKGTRDPEAVFKQLVEGL